MLYKSFKNMIRNISLWIVMKLPQNNFLSVSEVSANQTLGDLFYNDCASFEGVAAYFWKI